MTNIRIESDNETRAEHASNRRLFAKRLLAAGIAAPILARPRAAEETPRERPRRRPPLDSALVKQCVQAGHRDLPRVKELLKQEPKLANASWDWGGGDFETPLGAASHVGHRDIARYLLAKGARATLLCAAMLGDRASVAAFIRMDPRVVLARGPHGYSFLYHAASSGDLHMVEAARPHLAGRSADFNQALHAAARDGHVEMVQWLLNNGVTDPNTKGFGGAPVDVAEKNGHPDIVALLRPLSR